MLSGFGSGAVAEAGAVVELDCNGVRDGACGAADVAAAEGCIGDTIDVCNCVGDGAGDEASDGGNGNCAAEPCEVELCNGSAVVCVCPDDAGRPGCAAASGVGEPC